MSFKVDTSYEYYIENWFLEMKDLKCMSPQVISFMVTMYFAGYALNGFLSLMPD